MKNYRKLNIAEINQLTTQFCTAEDWSKINVVEGFSPDHITHTRFSGEIELGIFEKEMELPGGLKKKTGLHHVTLHNCSIGNNSLIENIPNYIANYRIGSDCFIQGGSRLLDFIRNSSQYDLSGSLRVPEIHPIEWRIEIRVRGCRHFLQYIPQIQS